MDEPRNLELEGMILQDPEDRQAYLVYADWLEARSHARAALIRAQLAETDPTRPGKKNVATDLLKKHKEVLLGTLSRFESAVAWRHGFVDSATLTDKSGPCAEHVSALASHPSARMLRHLSVTSRYLDSVIDALTSAPPVALRSLKLAHVQDKRESAPLALRTLLLQLARLESLSITAPFATEPIHDALPATLRQLALYSTAAVEHDLRGHLPDALTYLALTGKFALDPICLPALTELCLHTPVPTLGLPMLDSAWFTVQTPADLANIAGASWPRLTKLALHLRDAAVEPKDFELLFARTDMPALVELELNGAPCADALCARLCDAPFVGQLRSLSFAESILTETGADTLAESSAFDSLESLALTGTDADATRIMKARPELEIDGWNLHSRYDDGME